MSTQAQLYVGLIRGTLPTPPSMVFVLTGAYSPQVGTLSPFVLTGSYIPPSA